jgi:ATP-dependent Lhr-like helicase
MLDERIQQFIWAEGWEELRDAQELAIPHIISCNRDVIVAAATAAGKTEAAFLPALSFLMKSSSPGLVVYISPLKALINDQFARLDRLCERLEIPVWPWHGDISAASKKRFLQKREGVLLITPESLEALMCNRGTSVAAIFAHLRFFVIDELHAFIGSERGKQLQSLMHRVESVIHRSVPRIGLSATLGDMRLASGFLRPEMGDEVVLVESKSTSGEIKIQVKGFEEPQVIKQEDSDEVPEPIMPAQVTAHLFKVLRGSNNLVFPNSRSGVEQYTHLLNKMCEDNLLPMEFWPHHGNLSKEIRVETETALKQKDLPATGICTNTLELGIDIGAVRSIAQIGPPPSVASLRQRLGRSGRRKGEPAILRSYCIENAIGGETTISTELRLEFLKTTAMISLLLEGWFEPPLVKGVHLSTLIQQILSFIAQNGGSTIQELYALFCRPSAPFSGLSKVDFKGLIRSLGEKDLLIQDSAGTLLHGPSGEKRVNHYTFYSAFCADEEFRIVSGGRTLGTLPVSQALNVGQRILFAGRTWIVEEVDEDRKTIVVVPVRGGSPPLFSGGSGRTHTQVRRRMRQLLESKEVPVYLDEVAKQFLEDARANYARRILSHNAIVDQGGTLLLLTWLGDNANEAIAFLLSFHGFPANAAGPGVEVHKGQRSIPEFFFALCHLADEEVPNLDILLADTKNLQREKWDWALPGWLLRNAYASLYIDLDEAIDWVRELKAGLT